jgi:hypothetical protein
MLLQLDDKFKITTDSSLQNFQLEKLESITDRKTKEIKHEWKIIGYFGNNLKSVLRRYTDESLLDLENVTLHSVLDKLNEIEKTIETIVKKENIKLVSKDE